MLPPVLAARPVLAEHLEPIWAGFFAIANDRPFASGWSGPLSFLAVDAYARRRGWTGAEFDRWHELVTRMDRVYVEHINRKRET